MFGPWMKLFQLAAKSIGEKGGKIVTADIKLAEKSVVWTHADKIAELKNDIGLSPSYVKELIEDSSRIGDLEAIYKYLMKPQNNYSNDLLQNILPKIMNRLTDIQDKNALKEMIRIFKEKGISMIDHFDHFV